MVALRLWCALYASLYSYGRRFSRVKLRKSKITSAQFAGRDILGCHAIQLETQDENIKHRANFKRKTHWAFARCICNELRTIILCNDLLAIKLQHTHHVHRNTNICIRHYPAIRGYLLPSGPRLNIKTVLSTYGDFHVKDKSLTWEKPYLVRPSFLLRRPPGASTWLTEASMIQSPYMPTDQQPNDTLTKSVFCNMED